MLAEPLTKWDRKIAAAGWIEAMRCPLLCVRTSTASAGEKRRRRNPHRAFEPGRFSSVPKPSHIESGSYGLDAYVRPTPLSATSLQCCQQAVEIP